MLSPGADRPPTLLLAGAVADAAGALAAPGAVLFEWGGEATPLGGHIFASGEARRVRSHPRASGATVVEAPGCVAIPGLVNAHTHLDLTHLGPREFDSGGGFVGWADMIRRGRRRDPAGVAESVRRGVGLSIEGGVVAVGDIAGEGLAAAVGALRDSALLGVSYLELFGLGDRAEEAAAFAREAVEQDAAGRGPGVERVRLGLQPHAPYSASRRVYEAAASIQRDRGTPLSTHLGESPEEAAFVERAEGPLREFLESLGLWRETLFSEFGRGVRPIGHLAGVLEQARVLCAHLHDVTDEELALLARTGTPVVYCPRSAAYFGRPEQFGPHRYREMLDAGVRVALGTDSIVSLPASSGGEGVSGGAPTLSTLDEARLLVRRDDLPARTALAMATTWGADALGLDPALFTLAPGASAGIALVECDAIGDDPLGAVMRSDAKARLLRPGGMAP